jgi:hypothetical protein
MNVILAKLCRDCEEIHQEQRCPSCGSQYWDLITKFVPSVLHDSPEIMAAQMTLEGKGSLKNQQVSH